jgi:uncharacterized protein YegP (UPF0339 family)
MAARYELKKSADGQFRFNLVAANNRTILSSESYKGKAGAKGGIESCKANASNASRYDRRTSSSGQPYFVLIAANNEVIGRSETYSSNQAMEKGIAACKRVGPTAPISDLT